MVLGEGRLAKAVHRKDREEFFVLRALGLRRAQSSRELCGKNGV
jgi:hypothetical protein